MATTPKRVRRGGECICKRSWAESELRARENQRPCRYGWCVEARCPDCNAMIYGMGPAACRCDGAPRWSRYAAMGAIGRYVGEDWLTAQWQPVHVAVKPSIARRQRGRR
jgi:hypothetical protein